MLAAGNIGNIVLGIGLLLAAMGMRLSADTRKQYLASFYLSVLSLGFLFSAALSLSLSIDGDIQSIAAVLGLTPVQGLLFLTGNALLIVFTIHFWLDFESVKKEYGEDVIVEQDAARKQHMDTYDAEKTVQLHASDEHGENSERGDAAKIVEGTVEQVKQRLQNFDGDLKAVLEAEEQGDNRKTVVEYVEQLLDDSS